MDKTFLKRMIDDKRFILIEENGEICVVMLYSICDDETPYLDNLEHNFMTHNLQGSVLVIEDMISIRFKFSYRNKIKEFFYNQFPNIRKTVWRRDHHPKDKIYTLWKRGSYAERH